MKLVITKDEQQMLIMAIESAVKHASNSLQAASVYLPLVMKLQDAAEGEDHSQKTPPRSPKPPKLQDKKES